MLHGGLAGNFTAMRYDLFLNAAFRLLLNALFSKADGIFHKWIPWGELWQVVQSWRYDYPLWFDGDSNNQFH